MPKLNLALAVYAVLVLAGGVMGYVKAGSKPSLIMSIVAAALVFVGIGVAKSNASLGYALCTLVAAALALFFAYRLFGGSLMPSLPALILSVAALGALAYAHFASK